MVVGSNVTFTNCDFKAEEVVKFLLTPEKTQRDADQAKPVVTFENCTVDGQQVTPENLLKQLGISGTEGNDWRGYTFVIDGATRTIG